MSGTSLDTNILLSVLRAEQTASSVSRELSNLSKKGSLILSGPAYAELYGFYPNLDSQLKLAGIEVWDELPKEGWRRAGQAYAAYAARRKSSGGGLPRRIVTDFLIGAHASVHGLSLFTLNTKDYTDFPEVALLTLEE